MLITECSMADNIQAENPDVEFIKPCRMCPHMKRMTLPKILETLRHGKHEITLDADVIEKARGAIERMIAFNQTASAVAS
jgi:quinolinate synthase